MAIKTGFYNSVENDRLYNAEDMSRYFAGLYTKGVLQNYKDKFAVKANGGMQVKVPTGKAFFSDGKYIENTADIILNIDASDVVLGRIDSVVLRSDKNESVRNAMVVLKKGTPSSNPQPPAIEVGEYVEELLICNIRVDKLTENLTQSNIENTVANTDVCGYVTGLIDEVDTSDLYAQYQEAYKQFYIESQQKFDEWFNNIKETIKATALMRRYRKTYTTTQEAETRIAIDIPEHNSVLDIVELHINGLRATESEYREDGLTHIELTNAVEQGTELEIVVFKAVEKQ